jgi:hypothetical protein
VDVVERVKVNPVVVRSAEAAIAPRENPEKSALNARYKNPSTTVDEPASEITVTSVYPADPAGAVTTIAVEVLDATVA